MSAIRPLEPEDIPGVAAVYERVMRSGTRMAEPAIEDFFRETVLMQPWADPEIPSLVYDDPKDVAAGKDAQLLKAVETVMAEKPR